MVGVYSKQIREKWFSRKNMREGVMAILKKANKPVNSGFSIVTMDEVEFASRQGGGRGMAEETQKLIEQLSKLRVGQGIKLPNSYVIKREINGSTLYTYRGNLTVGRWADKNGKRVICRRDKNNDLFLFMVDPAKYPKRMRQTEAEE